MTPLMCAANNGHLEVLKYLKESCGADIHTKSNVSSHDMSIYYNSIIIIIDMDVMIIYRMNRLH